MRYYEIMESRLVYTKRQVASLSAKVQRLITQYEDTIPFSALGLHRSDAPIERKIAEILTTSSWEPNQISLGEVPLDHLMVQNQNGVGSKNLLAVLNHVETAGPPELLRLDATTYWVIEGHHRIALAILSGDRTISARIEVNAEIEERVKPLLDQYPT